MSNPNITITLNIPADVAKELQALLNIYQRSGWQDPSPVDMIRDMQKLDSEQLLQFRNLLNEQL